MKAVNLKYKYIFASLCLLVAFFSGYHLKQLYGSNHRQKNIPKIRNYHPIHD